MIDRSLRSGRSIENGCRILKREPPRASSVSKRCRLDEDCLRQLL